MPTSTHLNVLHLGSYSMFLGMDWLFIHGNKVDYYDKAIQCLDNDGRRIILQGNKKPISARMVTSMRKSAVDRRDVYCLQFIFLVTKGRILRMRNF